MTFCDTQLKELKDYAIAAKYEKLPSEQKANFFAQLSNEQKLALMAFQSTFTAGSALLNAIGSDYKKSIADIFQDKYLEFKKQCGFMLQEN